MGCIVNPFSLEERFISYLPSNKYTQCAAMTPTLGSVALYGHVAGAQGLLLLLSFPLFGAPTQTASNNREEIVHFFLGGHVLMAITNKQLTVNGHISLEVGEKEVRLVGIMLGGIVLSFMENQRSNEHVIKSKYIAVFDGRRVTVVHRSIKQQRQTLWCMGEQRGGLSGGVH